MTTSDAVELRPAPVGPAQLYDQYARRIYRYCAQRVGQQAAEDIVGEVFLAAVRAGACPAEPLPWLYGIATNILRRHRQAEVRACRALARTGADPLDNVAGVAESHEDASADRVSATAEVRRSGRGGSPKCARRWPRSAQACSISRGRLCRRTPPTRQRYCAS